MSIHTSPRRSSRKANLRQILVFFDGPQLALLESSQHRPLLAVAVNRYPLRYPLFACELTRAVLDRYMRGKLDLRSIFRSTSLSKKFFVDYAELSEGEAVLHRATPAQDEEEGYYPKRGIFARAHNYPYDDDGDDEEAEASSQNIRAKYYIDGKWEAREFSRFFGKLADIYSFTSIATDAAKDVSIDEKLFLRGSISNKPWQGGGSYLSFYGGVRAHTESVRPLDMKKIMYASPGHIEVSGDKETLVDIDKIVASFINLSEDIKKLHKAIRGTLSDHSALSASSDFELPTDALKDYVLRQALRLAEMIGMPNAEQIFRLCDNNVVVFSKVTLSFARRVRDLTAFYQEGRVRSEHVSFEIATA